MNPLLEVKLTYTTENNKSFSRERNLTGGRCIDVDHIDALIHDLQSILRYYQTLPVRYIKDILVDVRYDDIVAKSNRIRRIMKDNLNQSNKSIVGARFSVSEPYSHIITHYVTENDVTSAICKLEKAKQFLLRFLNGKANVENFNEKKKVDPIASYGSYDKNEIRDIIVDASVIGSFSIPDNKESREKDNLVVTFYHTELSVSDLLWKLGIEGYLYVSYGKDTISVTKDIYAILLKEIPYLISMISTDLSKLVLDQGDESKPVDQMTIPSAANEPVIGVIDTVYDTNVYFSGWVEYHDCLDDYEKYKANDEMPLHGSQVTSIIVDGPALNPELEDGCGRFKVRHFGVCTYRLSVPRFIAKIQMIISQNPDIHVWNLSLGTEDEVARNFISYDSYVLDSIQAERNVIFVVAGTNDSIGDSKDRIRLGSPADSINSLVVNSVKRDGSPTSYARTGPVLSFYGKPDVSYYGGDVGEWINAYSRNGIDQVCGTSFAVPWISRKLCYLIDVIGLSREVAKALVIDAAAGWNDNSLFPKKKNLIGYGVVPIHIEDIVQSKLDEIRFVVQGTSLKYKTLNKAIPIPKDFDQNFPFVAKATLCYFPPCERSQGVDYTSRELSLQFGRINKDGTIKDIHGNSQDRKDTYTCERKARKEYRKWDNTKFIISPIKKKNRPLKSYGDRMWGIALVSKERLDTRIANGLNFGLVITLKELGGVNRIQDFINACQMRGYVVNIIDVQNRIQIQQILHETVEIED